MQASAKADFRDLNFEDAGNVPESCLNALQRCIQRVSQISVAYFTREAAQTLVFTNILNQDFNMFKYISLRLRIMGFSKCLA